MGVHEGRYRAAEQALWAREGAAPSELRLDLARNGTTVRIQVVGDGPPVLFVHGVGNSGTSWAPLVARLHGVRCLVLDRPGCGLSGPAPAGLTDPDRFDAYARSLVVDVLDALDLETAAVVATSLGGYFALRGAAAHPDRIGRLVEIGWTVGAPVGATPLLMRLMAGLPRVGRLMARVPVGDRAARAMLAHIGLRAALDDGRLSQEMVDWWRAQLNHTATMRNEIAGAPPIMHPIRGMNDSLLLSDDVLRQVTSPVQLLWGTEDVFGGREVAVRFAARLPHAELELVPGGHAVWMDDPEGAAATTQSFLTRPPTP